MCLLLLIVQLVFAELFFCILVSLKNWHKLMRFLMTLKRGKFMTNMEKMQSKKEWEEAAVLICIVRLTYLNNYLEVVVALAVIVLCYEVLRALFCSSSQLCHNQVLCSL